VSEAFRVKIPVRFDDVDYARVLYYPQQVHFFVVALEDFFRDALKLPWSEVMFGRENLCMPTVALHVNYVRPLHFGQVAEIAIRVGKIGRTSVTFLYTVTDSQTSQLTCTAEQTVVFVDNATWQPVPVPDHYRAALTPFCTSEPQQPGKAE
jgi:YbgC/YbaW family acyl-CoA thioester hydrolase